MSMKLLALFFVQILCAFGWNDDINLPKLEFDSVKWQHEKVDTLLRILDTLSRVGNVTLVGWQDIYNTDGTLKEIRTVELTHLSSLPARFSATSNVNTFSGLPEILDFAQDLQSSTKMLLTASLQRWNEDGTIEDFLFVNQDRSVFQMDGDVLFGVVNATMPNIQSVNSFVKLLEGQTNLPVNVLRYVRGEIDMQSSIIVPHLLGSVNKAENATEAMIDAALLSMSQAVLKNTKLSKNIVLDMKKNFPGYLWYVAEEEYDSLVNSADVSIGLEYIFFNREETRSLTFSLFGQKL